MEVFVEKALPVSTVAGFHVPVFQKRGRGRTKRSSVTVQDPSSLAVRVRRCQIVSLPTLSRLLFLWTTPATLPFFLRSFTKASKTLFVSVKNEVRDNGKGFVVRRRAKKTINGAS